MAIVVEKSTTKKQRSVLRFLWAKGLSEKDIFKCLPFIVESVVT
jgi:hypothetical protein